MPPRSGAESPAGGAGDAAGLGSGPRLPRDRGRDHRAETYQSAHQLFRVPPMSLISIKGNTPQGPKYWRSLDQLSNTPQFRQWLDREFPDSAAEMLDSKSRRNVLKLMAASFGLAGLAGCRRPVEHIFPIAKGVEDYIPGQAYFYSTVFSIAGQITGLLVETHDGRPTKIEGNPDHPSSRGAATGLAQGSLLNLYDPDRSSKVLEGGKDSSWQKFE